MKLEKIETELNIKLPISYVLFHQSQTALINKLRDKEPDKSIYLATDENWIIETNKMLDLPKSTGMMNGKICIGKDGCGSYFLINLDGNDTTVYSTEHDACEWEEVFDSKKNDLNWNHKTLKSAENLKCFVEYFLTL